MQPRNNAIDMAKGFSLLTLPAIHSALFYSQPEFHVSVPGIVLAFVAEYLGAPVFMLTMGWCVTYGRARTVKNILLRSLSLFLLGYLLNLLKFGLPYAAGILPYNFFLENNIPHNGAGLLSLLLIGDILQLAAISYAACALVYRLRHYGWWALALMLLVVFCSPLTWDINTSNGPVNHFLQLLTGSPPASFFPVFPWVAYPLAGLFTAFFNKKYGGLSFRVFAAITGLMILAAITGTATPAAWQNNFYRLGPPGTMLHLSAAILFVGLCSGLSGILARTRFFLLLQALSRNVTAVYMIQWVLVCWIMGVVGYRRLEQGEVMIAMVVVTGLTIFLSGVYNKNRNPCKPSTTSRA